MENKFKFKKDDIEFEWSGEKDFVENQLNSWKTHILKILNQEEENITKVYSKKECIGDSYNDEIYIHKEIPYNEIKVTKNISIDDFLDLKAPENETDKVLVAGYYMERYEKYDSFNELDLYRVLNISNIDNYLLINTERGYLSFIGKKNNLNTYTLTYSGEIYVREGLE
ncbi:MAG: hypothetical protein U0354_01370 [Candidatus Sericytochromatia bacterium]